MKKITISLTFIISITASTLYAQTFSEKKLVTPNDDDTGETVFLDLDQDNDIDIVAMASDEVFWYENLGDEIFSNKILLASGFDSSSALTIADVDADGIEDILFIPRGLFVSAGSIQWIKNLGGGFFLSRQNFISGSFNRIRVGDFDNDGLDDIIAAELSGDIIYWSKNQGNGSYANPELIFNPNSVNIGSYEITDLDEDNVNELTVTIDGVNEAAVLKFEIDNMGTITETSLLSNSGTPNFSFSRLVDLDGDNKIDLLIRTSDCDVIWSKNFGSDIFANPVSLGFSCNVEGQFANYGDIDADSDIDIFFREFNGTKNDIFWMTNNGSAEFTSSLNNLSNDSINGNLSTVVLIDIDTDGDLDVFYTSQDEFGWFENTTDILSIDTNEINDFSIYPNPVINTLKYNVNRDIERIEVYNLLGQNIKNYGSNDFLDNSIDLSSLTNGVYLLKFYAQSQVYTTKVSKK